MEFGVFSGFRHLSRSVQTWVESAIGSKRSSGGALGGRNLSISRRRLRKRPVAASEKLVIADKLRRMTSGAELVIEAWGLQGAG